MQLVSLRVQATLYIELSRHGVIDAGGDRDGVHGVKIDEKDVVRHVVEGGVFQHFDLFLRVGDLGLVENDGFAVLEDAVVHVVHVRLTNRRSFLDDLARLDIFDVVEPSDFLIAIHFRSVPPFLFR